jgi:hypothetical protein
MERVRTTYGTLFVDETAMPVVHVAFRNGLTYLSAVAPLADMEPGPTQVRFHAPDGSLIFVAVTDWPAFKMENDIRSVTVELPIHLESASVGEPWGVPQKAASHKR